MEKLIQATASLDTSLLTQEPDEYDSLAYETAAQLRKADTNAASWPKTLEGIDPSVLTLPYFRILESLIDTAIAGNKASTRQLPAATLPEGKLWPDISRALLEFDPIQVRFIGPVFTKIVDVVVQGAEQTSNLIPAIQLLQNAILRLDPTSTTLTTTHYHYVRLCLLARAYLEATVVLDYPIYHIPTPDVTKQVGGRLHTYLCEVHESSVSYINTQTGLTQKITHRVFLEYFLFGAMCYMACGKFKKAQEFLEVVLVAPTQQNVTSLIMIEAYRKWLLLGLLIDGVGTDLPKAMSNNVVKHLRALGKPYECVVQAFKSGNLQRLQAEINEGNEIWQQDCNYGLMPHVFAAFRKFTVLKLSRTFAALPVEQIAKRTSPNPDDVAETLAYMQSLISSGELKAELQPSDKGGAGTLRFLSTQASQKTEVEVEQELALKQVQLRVLLKHISDYDHRLEVSQDYVEFLQKMKKARDTDKKANKNNAAGQPNVAGMPGAFGAPEDEDMMDDWN